MALFKKKNISIKPAGYGKATRGGIEKLKWFFDHGGFWLYIVCAVLIVLISNPRGLPNDAIDINQSSYSLTTQPKNDKIALLPEVLSFLQITSSRLGQGGSSIIVGIGNLIYANEQNKELREQLADYKVLKQQVNALEQKNIELTKLLNFRPATVGINFVTAQIIGDSGHGDRYSWVVNQGSTSGVGVGDYALDDNGLVGVVIEVGPHVARILRLSDPRFSIAITTENGNFRALLQGSGNPIAKLSYFEGARNPTLGEAVFSTGSGGFVPPFLPIGTVYRRAFGGLGVLLYAEQSPPIYVKIYQNLRQ